MMVLYLTCSKYLLIWSPIPPPNIFTQTTLFFCREEFNITQGSLDDTTHVWTGDYFLVVSLTCVAQTDVATAATPNH